MGGVAGDNRKKAERLRTFSSFLDMGADLVEVIGLFDYSSAQFSASPNAASYSHYATPDSCSRFQAPKIRCQ
jgi:hypothetical protein